MKLFLPVLTLKITFFFLLVQVKMQLLKLVKMYYKFHKPKLYSVYVTLEAVTVLQVSINFEHLATTLFHFSKTAQAQSGCREIISGPLFLKE